MRRIAIIAISVCFALIFSACGNNASFSTSEPENELHGEIEKLCEGASLNEEEDVACNIFNRFPARSSRYNAEGWRFASTNSTVEDWVESYEEPYEEMQDIFEDYDFTVEDYKDVDHCDSGCFFAMGHNLQEQDVMPSKEMLSVIANAVNEESSVEPNDEYSSIMESVVGEYILLSELDISDEDMADGSFFEDYRPRGNTGKTLGLQSSQSLERANFMAELDFSSESRVGTYWSCLPIYGWEQTIGGKFLPFGTTKDDPILSILYTNDAKAVFDAKEGEGPEVVGC